MEVHGLWKEEEAQRKEEDARKRKRLRRRLAARAAEVKSREEKAARAAEVKKKEEQSARATKRKEQDHTRSRWRLQWRPQQQRTRRLPHSRCRLRGGALGLQLETRSRRRTLFAG